MDERLKDLVPPEELRLLIVDRYEASEVIDRLGLTTHEVLDLILDDVYDNIKDFWELHRILGIEEDGTFPQAEETD